ncbi:MAG: hypothetical protein K8I03_07800 [Ignavibacteria bacterium]|nr:hypothetical protein [Ignavibacteria bacterium]
MKTVRVQYKVKPEFAETNKTNISKVMAELRNLNDEGIKYSTFLFEDGQTFLHFAMFRDDDGQKKLNELESFKKFGAELKASGPVEPPKPEVLNLVDSCYNIF